MNLDIRSSIVSMSSAAGRGAIAALGAIGLCSAVTVAAQAQEVLTNSTIQFSEDTIIEFEVAETQGFLQSTFGVLNTTTGKKTPLFVEKRPFDAWVGQPPAIPQPGGQRIYDDYKGTVAGGSIVNGDGQANPLIKFRFEANTPYVFYLDSVNPYTGFVRTTLLSTDMRDARFSGSLVAGQPGNEIDWEDTGLRTPIDAGNDMDFNDFRIIAGGFPLQPCPFKQ